MILGTGGFIGIVIASFVVLMIGAAAIESLEFLDPIKDKPEVLSASWRDNAENNGRSAQKSAIKDKQPDVENNGRSGDKQPDVENNGPSDKKPTLSPQEADEPDYIDEDHDVMFFGGRKGRKGRKTLRNRKNRNNKNSKKINKKRGSSRGKKTKILKYR